jgi:branched-chain amino acid transport system permease protein
VFLCILSVRNIAISDLGRSMRAVRDDEIAAEAAGINTTQIKVLALCVFGDVGGRRGRIAGPFHPNANPNDFTFLKSVEVVVSVVLGGLGSDYGKRSRRRRPSKCSKKCCADVPGVIWTSLGLIAL